MAHMVEFAKLKSKNWLFVDVLKHKTLKNCQLLYGVELYCINVFIIIDGQIFWLLRAKFRKQMVVSIPPMKCYKDIKTINGLARRNK